jgi:hypothetical protein
MTCMITRFSVTASVFTLSALCATLVFAPVMAQALPSALIGPKTGADDNSIVVEGSKNCIRQNADATSAVDLGCLNERLKLMSLNASAGLQGEAAIDAAFQSTTAGAFTAASARQNSTFYQALGGRMPSAQTFSNPANRGRPAIPTNALRAQPIPTNAARPPR